MDPLPPLTPYEPLAQTVTRHLRDAILDGRLAPGVPLRQEAVARELGTSRLPVREALQQLPRLSRTIKALWATSQQYRRVLLATVTPADRALFESEHRLLVDALARRSRETGEALVGGHVERARARLAENRELCDA